MAKKTTSKTSRTNKTRAINWYARRRSAFRRRLKKDGLDAFLITNDRDIRYLTGYPGEDCWAVVTAKRIYLISDFRYEESLRPFRSVARVVMRTESLAHNVRDIVKGDRITSLGIESEYMTVALRGALAKLVGARTLVNTRGVLLEQRMIKDSSEIKTIRKAIRIAQDALTATLAEFEPGETEAHFAARLEFEARARGADGLSFTPIIAGQANGSKPHYTPSPKVRITRRKPLLIDWGVQVDGYISDMTRTYGVGSMPAKVREIYQIVLDAHLAAIDAIRPGVRLRDVDSTARDLIRDAGYGDAFGHGLGHGIGLNVHELPSLSQRSGDAVLEAGMVVTVEPGIYLPGIGGVRIEDDIEVTAKGHRNLSNYPKALADAIL